MNRNPFNTEAWEGEEPSEYELELDAAEAAGEPWFSFAEWERRVANRPVLPPPFGPVVADDSDQDIAF